jgi:hypothetical protein
LISRLIRVCKPGMHAALCLAAIGAGAWAQQNRQNEDTYRNRR